MIKLSYSFKMVFKTYRERLSIDTTRFYAVLREEFASERDETLIYFIAGGRTPLAYDLKRDGPKVRGKIYFNDINLDNPDDTIKSLGKVDVYWCDVKGSGLCDGRKRLTDRDIEKIKLLRSKNIDNADIAEYFGVSVDTIYRRLREDKNK